MLGTPPEPPAPPPPPEPSAPPPLELPPEPTPAASELGAAGVPWQRRDRLGLVAAFVETARDALFAPTTFFRAMRQDRGIGEALGYGVLVGWLGQLVNAVYQLILYGIVGSSVAGARDMPPVVRVLLSRFEGMTGFLMTVLFGWLLVAAGLFIWSGLVHLALLVTGAAKRPFETSLSVVCYAESAALWTIVPFCGGFITVVHLLVLATLGLSETHEISVGQALLAVLLPLLLCCCCVPVLVGAVVGGLGAAGGMLH